MISRHYSIDPMAGRRAIDLGLVALGYVRAHGGAHA
jgi:hypothetical protein